LITLRATKGEQLCQGLGSAGLLFLLDLVTLWAMKATGVAGFGGRVPAGMLSRDARHMRIFAAATSAGHSRRLSRDAAHWSAGLAPAPAVLALHLLLCLHHHCFHHLSLQQECMK
jgi:hypothetical protein